MPRIVFVSTMEDHPWGDSEELWSRAAGNLAADGVVVAANIPRWAPLHPRIQQLRKHGITISTRPRHLSLQDNDLDPAAVPITMRGRRDKAGGLDREPAAVASVARLLESFMPNLVVYSCATSFPPVDFIELHLKNQIPFVTISQTNHPAWWFPDTYTARLRPLMQLAFRCYFVSEANRHDAANQLGCELINAEVIRKPFDVDYDAAPLWPPLERDGPLRMACVAKLHPPSNGQDLLLEVLGQPAWLSRSWRLDLYGEGPTRDVLQRLADRFRIGERIEFRSHVSDIAAVWAQHHLLVIPSRFGGLPRAIVEAMLCARPVVATNVAGHAEVLQDGVTGFLAEAPTSGSVSKALERFWAQREQAETMGKAAATRIRQLVPRDPARIFSEKLKHAARQTG
jgi:glycosyltransferase involved in cell wall biosynthesis